ncbi:MAG: hypothetical protein JXB24_03040 [Bacteroidales bacterium]|nr:hypothetical protein [Bacteroidales bacterium]
MKNKFYLGLATLSLVVFFTACSKLPQTEIDRANQAIDSAKAAGAELYLPAEFTNLRDTMKAAMEEIEVQKSKFIKNFGTSKELLAEVTLYASEVTMQTEEKKVALKTEIQTTLNEVKILLEENKKLITEAPKGKEGTSALVAMKNEINALESNVNEINASSDQDNYLTTLNKVKVTKEHAVAINTELKDIIAKYQSNVRGRKS